MEIINNGISKIKSGIVVAAEKVLVFGTHKNNPDILLKITQIAVFIFEGIKTYSGRNYLEKLQVTLVHSVNFNFLVAFLKLPYNWLNKVNLDTIDVVKLRNNLAPIQAEFNAKIAIFNWETKQSGVVISTEHPLQQALTDLLNEMEKNGLVFKTEEEFRKRLSDNFYYLTAKAIKNSAASDALELTKLKDLEIPLHQPLLGRLTAIGFSIIDVLCVPMVLQEYKLNVNLGEYGKQALGAVGLGEYAASIGNNKAVQWVANQNIGSVVLTFCGISFGLQLLETIRQLMDTQVSVNEKKRLQYTIVASATEFVFSVAALAQVTQPWLIGFGLIAKATGVVCLIWKPARDFSYTEIDFVGKVIKAKTQSAKK